MPQMSYGQRNRGYLSPKRLTKRQPLASPATKARIANFGSMPSTTSYLKPQTQHLLSQFTLHRLTNTVAQITPKHKPIQNKKSDHVKYLTESAICIRSQTWTPTQLIYSVKTGSKWPPSVSPKSGRPIFSGAGVLFFSRADSLFSSCADALLKLHNARHRQDINSNALLDSDIIDPL